jgi:2'-5' RNA ligase
MNLEDSFLRQRHDFLWSQTSNLIQNGKVEIDPILAAGQGDRRRGMTLLFRPPDEIQRKIVECLDELRELEPEQVYYHPVELHVTFLSMFTARENNKALFERTGEFVAAVSAWARGMVPFSISFRGITASPAALMIQGFTDAGKLNGARDSLRDALRVAGLGRGLDERYRLEVAHMTAMRFRHPLRDGTAFADALTRMRGRDFGSCEVNALDLVSSDWYMSRDTIQDMGHFRLKG